MSQKTEIKIRDPQSIRVKMCVIILEYFMFEILTLKAVLARFQQFWKKVINSGEEKFKDLNV